MLGLDADAAKDASPGLARDLLQESRLTDPRLAPDDERSASPRASISEQALDQAPLGIAADQH